MPRGTETLKGDQLVHLHLVVSPDGSIRETRIAKSSGHSNVDEAALDMVKRAGPLPPFSRDMEKKDTSIVLPVHINITPPIATQEAIRPVSDKTRYVDPKTGFTVEVSFPFQIERPRSDRNYDRLISVVSVLKTPPVAGSSNELCSVGFKASPGNIQMTQAELNAPEALRARADAMVKIQSTLQAKIETIKTFQQDQATGIEFVIAPGFGPEHERIRQYISMVDRPAGRITVACATDVDAMPEALGTFRNLRDQATIDPK
ncbi:protein TonB [Arboricoccus pini]|uniref:Protein TonB n=2 Tax=Arboricoccus pini TaxID=1963835 RepID=A0A212RRH6_9PROT|nr:protein TonB [Arboricoccus pini]